MPPLSQPQVRVGVGVFVLQSVSHTQVNNPAFLIGKRKGSHGAGTWALPGGHLEFSEKPEECAAREVLEETGLKVTNLRFLTATDDYMEPEGKHYITWFVVGVREDESAEAEVLERDKCEQWEWWSWEKMVGMVDAAGQGEEQLFLPLVDLVRQRPGLVPMLV